MNIYRYQFVSTCPVNGASIIYSLEIRATAIVRVEHIVTACQLHPRDFHETIADALFERFGHVQILKAHHHGVDIETVRGEN